MMIHVPNNTRFAHGQIRASDTFTSPAADSQVIHRVMLRRSNDNDPADAQIDKAMSEFSCTDSFLNPKP
jgi:hypothetical protein